MSMLRVAIGDPVPVGKYWHDITADKLAAWQDWLAKNSGAVVVTATEERDTLTWYAFEVKKPIAWEGPGYPTIVAKGTTVTSSSDVMNVPTVEDPTDKFLEAAAGGIKWGVAALLALIGFQLIGKRKPQ